MGIQTRLQEIAHQALGSRKRSLNGKTVVIPHMAGHGSANGRMHEDFLDAFLYKSLAGSHGAFVDVGANLGQILLKVLTHSDAHRYVGFEPSTFCASYVERLIELNGFEGAEVFPFALSDRAGFLSLFHSNTADEQATTVPDFWTAKNRRGKAKNIACLAGDDVVDGLEMGKVGILKVDVEGGELEVLKGFARTIRRDRPLILIEILPYLDPAKVSGYDAGVMARRRDRIRETLSFVDSIGYRCDLITPTGGLAVADKFEVDVYDASLSNYALSPVGNTKSR
jgi:FkbM family methyltransferase